MLLLFTLFTVHSALNKRWSWLETIIESVAKDQWKLCFRKEVSCCAYIQSVLYCLRWNKTMTLMWHTILFLQYFKKPTEDNRSVSAASERFVLISSGYRGWKGERRLCSTFPFITFLGSCLPFAPNLFHFYRLQRFCVDQKRKKTQPKNLPTKQEASWMTVTSLIL